MGRVFHKTARSARRTEQENNVGPRSEFGRSKRSWLSTYSRSAAEVLASITGSPYFPGGLGEFVAPANAYLKFDTGPTTDVRLQWASYYDAADQAGISRLYGDIHPRVDDFTGRVLGATVGTIAWQRARTYFDGTAP